MLGYYKYTLLIYQEDPNAVLEDLQKPGIDEEPTATRLR